jgi:hypothetical protein
MQALKYINKETISFEEYKQLPEIIKDQYCLTFIKTKYYYQLKPEIVKQKEDLVKNIAIALCEKKNKNSVANLIDEAEEIINMPYYPNTENPDPKFYECYDTYRYIDKHVHDYTMQNEPYNLTISDAITLMEIILIK